MQFKDLELRQVFTYKGSIYIKNSSRTAKMLSNSNVKYFAKAEELLLLRNKPEFYQDLVESIQDDAVVL